MKYTLTVEADDRREKIVFESGENESERHTLLKMLGYLLYSDQTDGLPLRIEQPFENDRKLTPDVAATDPTTDQITVWIDCGQTDAKRLERVITANRKARIIVMRATSDEIQTYLKTAARTLPTKERRASVEYIAFDDDFIETTVSDLRGTNNASVAITDETLYLTFNGTLRTTEIFRLSQ